MNSLHKIRSELRTKNRGGAPKGNRNALKTDARTAEVRARLVAMRALMRRAKQALAQFNAERASHGR